MRAAEWWNLIAEILLRHLLLWMFLEHVLPECCSLARDEDLALEPLGNTEGTSLGRHSKDNVVLCAGCLRSELDKRSRGIRRRIYCVAKLTSLP